MREFDREGLLLASIQADIFEKSVELYDTSSPIFIRRFMKSGLAKEMDTAGFMDKPFNEEKAFERLDEEYGKSSYGVRKIPQEVMHWIGYIYRYWAYVYDTPSSRIYKIVTTNEMEQLYPGYHSLDPLAAIQRILEAKGLSAEGGYSIEEGVRLMKQVREGTGKYIAKSTKQDRRIEK